MNAENIRTFILSENLYKNYRDMVQINDKKNIIKFYSQNKKIGFPFQIWSTNLSSYGYQSANDFYEKILMYERKTCNHVKIKEVETSAQVASEIAGLINLAKYRQDHNKKYDDIICSLSSLGLSDEEILKRIDCLINYGIERHVVKVTYTNNDTMITPINGTVEEIKKYYIGNIFNIGVVEDDLQKVVKVFFLN